MENNRNNKWVVTSIICGSVILAGVLLAIWLDRRHEEDRDRMDKRIHMVIEAVEKAMNISGKSIGKSGNAGSE